jgi:alpha-1,2-mannosyltransferase
MAGTIINSLRTGDWLTRERLTIIPFAVLFASVVAVAFVIATLDGYLDLTGQPVGTDFSNVYAAGTYALEGRPDAPYDNVLQHERERALLGDKAPFYGWHYPPFFLFIAAALALMPYGLALGVWQLTTFLLYLLSIHAILSFCARQPNAPPGQTSIDPLWLLLTAAFPAVLINLGHGHNGFLTAALMGGALVLLDQRPALAGILFGLLSYKPQFGLMIPLVLMATQRWRAFASAAMTVAALAIATTVVFGPKVWDALLASTHFSRVIVLEAGGTGFHKIQSVFSWTRLWGGSVNLAYVMQGITIVALAVTMVWLWRSNRPYPLKAGALIIASLLSTPYALDYDMMVLAPAIAFLAMDGLQRGFGPGQKTAMAVLWMVPIAARSIADVTLLPIGVWAMLAALILSIRRDQSAPVIATTSTTSSRAI